MSDVTRIEQAFDALLTRLADSVDPVRGGSVIRTAALPLVWSLNQLRLTEPLDPDEVVEVADDVLGDLHYRHVVARPTALDPETETELVARGWAVEHEVVMAVPARDPDDVDPRVVELAEDEMLELMAHWLAERHPGAPDPGMDQVLEYIRREGRASGEVALGVRGEGGAAVAVAKVRSLDGLGWVEDVYTLPPARRQGLARVLVGRAADLALARGAPAVIVADADGFPQHLYASLGFRPLAGASIFHLDLR